MVGKKCAGLEAGTNYCRDRKLTLAQNYQKLGLSRKFGGPTGGIEKHGKENQTLREVDGLAMPTARKTGKLELQEVQVERDPETGQILRVLRPADDQPAYFNPLNDPLNDIMNVEAEPARESTGVVAELEKEAAEEEEALARRRPRQQSNREEEWLEQLLQKHGENTRAMARDRKLNPMQQTEGDLKRRLKKYVKKASEVG